MSASGTLPAARDIDAMCERIVSIASDMRLGTVEAEQPAYLELVEGHNRRRARSRW